MPIKLNVVDNNSSVRVKTKSNDEVRLQPDCGIDNARYEALVNKERQERIAADEILANSKQNLGYIRLEDFPDKQFDSETVDLLKKYLINKIYYNGYIYSLSVSTGNIKTYLCPRPREELEFNKIEVDVSTGEFQLLRSNEHFVTQEQIDFWNNKVTAYAIDREADDKGDGYNSTLVLDRHNTIDENGNVIIKEN